MECDLSETLLVVSGMAFEAGIAKGNDIQTVYGLDTAKLTADIEQAISNGAKGILSFGVAAGLMPSLPAGRVVVARKVKGSQQNFTADETWSAELCRQLPTALHADIAGIDRPVTTVEEKVRLREMSEAVAADMESHHAARLAKQYNLPFAALRVILDTAQCTLPPAALLATKPDGTIDYFKLMGSLLAHPAQLPAMMRLGRDHNKAKSALLHCSKLLKVNLFGLLPAVAR